MTCILITYCFSVNFIFEQTLRESSIVEEQSVSSETADRFLFCREVCLLNLDQEIDQKEKIGGEGIVVEVDECKIGRRKYQRGCVVERSWIFGMIERGNAKNYWLGIGPGNKRNSHILMDLIKKYVAIWSTIHSDC